MSKKSNEIKNEIARTLRQLIEAGLCANYVFPEVRKIPNTILVMVGTVGSGLITKRKSKRGIYEDLLAKKLYTLTLKDGSILQLSYTFSKEDLIAHRLAYIPRPVSFDEENIQENLLFNKNPIMRFDYSAEKHDDHYHSRVHLHLGDIEECRIPVSAPIGPRSFIFFILRNFYKTASLDYCKKYKSAGDCSFPRTLVANEEGELHIGVPSI